MENSKIMKQDSSSLFTPKNRGGATSGGGYNFQDSFITLKLPKWLTTPGFKSYIKESVDDASVHFEESGKLWTWLYQMKDYALDINGLKVILKNFKVKMNHPGLNPQQFFIGCCGISKSVKSLWQMIKEYRGLQKGMTDQQLETTKSELSNKIVGLGLGEYTDLLMTSVNIEHGYQGMRDGDIPAMQNSFLGVFARTKLYSHEGAGIIDKVFTSLSLVVNKNIRKPITKQELEETIRSELVTAKKGPATVVYLHGWISQEYEDPSDVVIDWRKHFNHPTLKTPTSDIWQKELLTELHSLRREFDSDGKKRNIWLRAKAPLSAGFAFGYAFPEALGYNIQIEQPSPGSAKAIQYWQTDTPDVQEVAITSVTIDGNQEGTDLIVAIGATDDPKPKVEEFLRNASLNVKAFLYLYPQAGPSDISINEQSAVGFARTAKKEIRRACSQFSPRLIHLFLFGPLGFAVLLGQKMNGLVNIQCYERSKEQAYVPSCLIPA